MNAQNQWMQDDEFEGADNSVSYGKRDQVRDQRMRRHAYERRGARPSSFNGIHRRRNKRFAW
ncbi:MAG TPA: hypothetical protein VGI75_12555 [Pirellulales bacterium]|jgi:hypothetical protein